MKRILNVLKVWRFFKPSSLKIYQAKDVFSHIDPAFKNIKLPIAQNVDSVAFYKLVFPATFMEVLSSLSTDISLLIISEEAVVKICLSDKEFLTQEKQKAFFYLGGDVVAKISSYKDGLHIDRYDLNAKNVWETKHDRIFIAPAINF